MMRAGVFLILIFMISGASAEEAKGYAGFFRTHGLIWFYGSQCPHCKQFAPILKHWTSQNKVEVLSLSLDNKPLPEFPNFLPATTEWINVAFGNSAMSYPATFIVNPETKALYSVGFGSMTETELNDRMKTLIPKIKAYESNVGAS